MPALQSGSHVGPYEILALIGAGGMGEVYRARDTRLKRDVAIKILPETFARDPARLARFQREAEVLASLNHPNIAAIHDLVEANGSRFLVLELVEGDTLGDRLRQRPVVADEALRIAKQIAEAMEAAHERGIIHRDLKPANIKITTEGHVKVLDFGLAKIFEPEVDAADPTDAATLTVGQTGGGVMVGTAAYMSPEQARGKNVDVRTDIWAFGCVLYELLTGKQAFSGETISDMVASILKGDPDWNALPADVDRSLLALLRRCLQRNPRARFHHAADLRLAVEDLLAEPGPSDAVRVVASRSRTLWLAWALFGVAAIAAVILGVTQLRSPRETALWVTIPPPAGGFGGAPRPAVSPDGRYVAFIAPGSGGGRALWVRALDSLSARQLPGTDGADMPFWSPDSRGVGFFASGKLKKIDVDGGLPITLADAPIARGGTWGSEGEIVFAPVSGDGLYRVSSAGGKATRVTALDSRAESFHNFPSFLPDGRHFLFSVLSHDEQSSGIYVGQLDSPETKRISDVRSRTQYSLGYLLYVRERNLFAQPFDPDRLELSGEPVSVAEGVGWGSSSVHEFAFSASAHGVLAFWSGVSIARTQLTWFDRHGNELTTAGAPGHYYHISLSPDGKQIAAELSDPKSSTLDVWLINAVTGASSRLTSDEGWAGSPVWSPDSSQIFYVSFFKAQPLQLREMRNPSAQDVASDIRGIKWPIDWASSGEFVILVHATPKTGADLWFLEMSRQGKATAYLQTDFSEPYGQLSPDGRWLAYVSNESGRYEAYLDSFPKRGTKIPVSTEGGLWPKWSQSGRELYYVSLDRSKMMAVPLLADSSGVHTGSPTVLFQMRTLLGDSGRSQYSVTPDGQRFLINMPIQDQPAIMTVGINWAAGLKK